MQKYSLESHFLPDIQLFQVTNVVKQHINGPITRFSHPLYCEARPSSFLAIFYMISGAERTQLPYPLHCKVQSCSPIM